MQNLERILRYIFMCIVDFGTGSTPARGMSSYKPVVTIVSEVPGMYEPLKNRLADKASKVWYN